MAPRKAEALGCTVARTMDVDLPIMSFNWSCRRVDPGNGAKPAARRANVINLRMLESNRLAPDAPIQVIKNKGDQAQTWVSSVSLRHTLGHNGCRRIARRCPNYLPPRTTNRGIFNL